MPAGVGKRPISGRVQIDVRLWNGAEATCETPRAALVTAIKLWEADPAHPGRPGVTFSIAGKVVLSESRLTVLKRSLERYDRKREKTA